MLHPGSVQLIGIRGATTREFGYCGNDFAAFALLDQQLIEEVDDATRRIGRWLGADGYRGAFGVDFMWSGGTLYFAEINPRMQGSTAVSTALATGLGLPDVVLDHLAATLELRPTASLSLSDWARELPPSAHLVVHNVVR